MMNSENMQSPSPARRLALWNLGFRPLYLLAGTFSAVAMLWWIAQFAGGYGAGAWLQGPLWHAHEMIFGYAFAVIVGFLFTAVRNWTNEPTPTGAALAAITALWLAGRLFGFTPWPVPAAAADVAFAMAAAFGIGRPLLAAGNRRNYFFIAVLLGFGAANLAFHLGMAGIVEFPVQRGLQTGLNLVMFLIAVVGGRVIPMFTANGVPGTRPVRHPWIERASLAGIVLLIAADALGIPVTAIAVIAAAIGIAHAARLALWQPWLTVRKPIVWILHASYAWIAVHLVLRALATFDIVPSSASTHALTVGAIGGMTLGMMTRTARGHTGLPLATSRSETAAYLLMQCGALVRVFGPLVAPAFYMHSIVISGLLWAAAFVLFTIKFLPILTRPRADGREG
jgi:uncharacterized protein involved in response to NO